MVYEVDEEDEVIAACGLCPNEDCGSLVISYRTAGTPSSEPWDFLCARCGTVFSVPDEELVFHSVPLENLLDKVSKMAHA
jgi:hypothetical protein